MSRFIPRLSAASAPVARERLETLLEHDRNLVDHADLMAILREEISALVRRHSVIDTNNVHFMESRTSTASTLTVDIEVPVAAAAATTRYCV